MLTYNLRRIIVDEGQVRLQSDRGKYYTHNFMALEQKDIELLERIIYKNGDDIAVSIARSFERLEERIDSAESRIFSRLEDIENKITDGQEEVRGQINTIASDLKDIIFLVKQLKQS